MQIRKTADTDLPRLLELYAKARAFMADHGNPRQWGATNWPPEALLRQDIANGNSYVCVEDDCIVGTFFYIAGHDIEPTYRIIENGRWLTGDDGNYLALHRVAVAVNHRGTGIAEAILNHSEKVAKEQGKISLRIDTHRGNLPMRRMLERNGFTHCGRIRLANGDPREAYEKII